MSTDGSLSASQPNADKPQKLSGYMYRIEQRPIGGPTRKKYWFALSDETPFLYWYKNKTDSNCQGKIPLSGSAFTFDPREKGRFEIHVNNENHILETSDNRARDTWLRQLQNNRRRLYERENVDSISKVEIISQESFSTLKNPLSNRTVPEHAGTEMAQEVEVPGPSDEKNLEEEIYEAMNTMSTFYLDANGELNPRSLELPPPPPPSQDIMRSADEFLSKIKQSDVGEPARKALNKARNSFKFPYFLLGSGGKSCENCKNLVELIEKLKERCYELTDTVSANQDLSNALRSSLLVSTNQRQALEKQLENTLPSEHIQFILNYEGSLTALQLNASEQSREIQTLRRANKELSDRNAELLVSLDAFRDSIRSKEEVILRMTGDNKDTPVGDVSVNHEDLPEGILVDGSDDQMASVHEDTVADLNELRDIAEGYKKQNVFFSQEILDLQKIVQSLEQREATISNWKHIFIV
ncbi:hypothetical protein L596_002720 [Steinernema carpocapsae]|uniref:PH domain-containing protein n=1 Tax=Steinernema carpocapsae TaxID=34508 RepID=A0A4U8URW4_STECR|nr:hypothetical protein L596_002720 [Steinernema carpocapsae]